MLSVSSPCRLDKRLDHWPRRSRPNWTLRRISPARTLEPVVQDRPCPSGYPIGSALTGVGDQHTGVTALLAEFASRASGTLMLRSRGLSRPESFSPAGTL